MPFAYTVCSLSYVPFAIALGRSILKHDPESTFFIGIVDRNEGRIVLPQIEGITYIEVDQLDIEGFGQMCRNYSIFELCCACKPFFAQYLFDTFGEIERVMYFDTDILAFDSLKELDETLATCNILLTPHIITPLGLGDGTLYPNDENFTGAGVYNAGFYGLRRSAETSRFLAWWSERLRTKCRIAFHRGLCADQSWLSLAPLFFDGVHIEKSARYNAAYWNLHERKIVREGDKYFVNGENLVFFHYSGHQIKKPEVLSSFQNRAVFDRTLKELFSEYRTAVLENGYHGFSNLPSAFSMSPKVRAKRKIRDAILKRM